MNLIKKILALSFAASMLILISLYQETNIGLVSLQSILCITGLTIYVYYEHKEIGVEKKIESWPKNKKNKRAR